MGMFDTYDRLNPYYIPNNINPTPSTTFVTIEDVLPRPLKDISDRHIGYTWNQGEHFRFTLTTDDMIAILSDSIIFNNAGEKPTIFTAAIRLGQQAYNTVDAKSWTYVGRTNDCYVWVEDDELTYPTDGDKSIVIQSDMTNRYSQLNIYNFKWENILEAKSDVGASTVYLDINEETSKLLKPGIYYCTLKIVGKDDCRIKNKFTIVIN